MKRHVSSLTIAWVAFFGLVTLAAAQGGNTPAPKISQDEQNLAQKINAAPDPAAKLKAAADLLKKHPKTSIRGQVADEMAIQIAAVTDPTQKLALAQQFQTTFSDPADEETVVPIVIDALADANQVDQAFAKGSDFLTRHPESLRVLVELLSIGTEQAKKQNAKFLDQSIRYGTQAIAMAEADKKPANYTPAAWQDFKTRTVPSMYQSLGLLHMMKGATAEAKAQYTKASQVAPSDPFNFVMLGAIVNEEYQSAAKTYQGMASGPEKDAQLKKVQDLLDIVIDAYAHAVGAAEGNAALAQIRQQYLQDLEKYYKYRHKGSTEGMQQLIDKYKTAPKP